MKVKKLFLILPLVLLGSCSGGNSNNEKNVSDYFKSQGDSYSDAYGKPVYYFTYLQDFESDQFEYSMYYSESRSFFRMVCGFGSINGAEWGASYVDFYPWGNFKEGNFNFGFLVNGEEVLKLAYSNVQIESNRINSSAQYTVISNKGISKIESSANNGIMLFNRGIEFFDHWVTESNLPSFR